jgi:hypothetical protein
MPFFDAAAVAGRLLGRDGVQALRVKGGRNAEVWRIESADGAHALKRYWRADASERFDREAGALGFLTRHGVINVPSIVAAERESNVILLSWLPGIPVIEATESDILACVAFAARLKELARTVDAPPLPDAKEACDSVTAILEQIDARNARLRALADRDLVLRRFLDTEIVPRRDALTALERIYPIVFPKRFKTLSPADFGVHNALRDAAGHLHFLDFEYFGWDDPAKLTADFLLHPGMNLPPELRALFAAHMREVFGEESGFGRRVEGLLPAYRLRWALIMMNPVLDAAACLTHQDEEFAAAVRFHTERARRFLEGGGAVAIEGGKRNVR